MSQPYFDTQKYARLLVQYEFSHNQVEGLMSAQILVLQSTLDKIVTHADLQRSAYALRLELKDSEHRLDAKITEVKHQLETQIMALDSKITKVDARITQSNSELKSYTLKNTLATITTMAGLFIGYAALDI